MGGNEPIKYVTFGGVQVPESSTRKVTQQNGKPTYNVWVEGAKVSYPKQETQPSNTKYYYAVEKTHDSLGEQATQKNISKSEFDVKYAIAGNKAPNGWFYFRDKDNSNNRYVQMAYNDNTSLGFWDRYYEANLDTTPKIEVSTNKGVVFDSQNITISNLQGATITGSDDEDNITLNNSSNCTVDVSNANNNFFVSDNVTVVNGKNNSVKAGDNDTVTYQTHNYETNTDKTTASYEDEGTYKQK